MSYRYIKNLLDKKAVKCPDLTALKKQRPKDAADQFLLGCSFRIKMLDIFIDSHEFSCNAHEGLSCVTVQKMSEKILQ